MFQVLYVGDIVLLEKGFRVTATDVPAYCFPDHSPYDETPSMASLLVGQKLNRVNSPYFIQKDIREEIIVSFKKRKVALNEYILDRFLNNQIPIIDSPTYQFPEGQYIITELELRGARHDVTCQTYNPEDGQPVRKCEFTIIESYFRADRDIKLVRRAANQPENG